MLFVRDEALKFAFTTMLNKLIFSYRLLLKPYLAAMQSNTADEALLCIQYLEKQLDQNAEQRSTLHKLMAQGYIDQIFYTQESNELLLQARDFRSEIEALNNTVAGDTTKVYETERLINYCKRGEMLTDFNESLFELFVDHILIYSRQRIGFVLRCGITFEEMI